MLVKEISKGGGVPGQYFFSETNGLDNSNVGMGGNFHYACRKDFTKTTKSKKSADFEVPGKKNGRVKSLPPELGPEQVEGEVRPGEPWQG